MKFRLIIFSLLTLLAFSNANAFQLPDNGKKKKRGKEDRAQTVSGGKSAEQKLERLLLDAEKAKVTEDWENAIKIYKEVLDIDSKNSNAHFQLAQIYSATNKLADAEKEAAEAVKLDAGNKWYLEMLAEILMNEGKEKEAIETFNTLIEKFPNNPDYYLNLGFLYSKQGKFEEAIKTYNHFEKNFGIDEQVISEKKNLYLHLGKFNDAVDEVKKLEDAFPGETEYMLQEADLYRANRMNDKAAEIYKKILAAEPDNPQAQLGLTSINAQKNDGTNNFENLKSIFENPKVGVDTKVSILLISYIQMNSEDSSKRGEALQLADILTAVHPDESKAHAVKGDLLYLNNDYDKSLEAYTKSLSLSKDVFNVWQQIMVIYNVKRDWANVLKTASEAMEYFPNQAMVYLFKGGAELQMKDYEKALKSFSKGDKMSADNDKLRAQFLANLGDTYHSLKRDAASDSAYDQSLKLDPENAYVLNNYSYYLSLRKQNLEKAKQMSAYANQLESDNSSFLDTYAWILFQLNDFTGAKEWQEKALKAGGDKSATELEHYGDILFKTGDKEGALNYWKKAKDLGTDSDTIERKIAEQKYLE